MDAHQKKQKKNKNDRLYFETSMDHNTNVIKTLQKNNDKKSSKCQPAPFPIQK